MWTHSRRAALCMLAGALLGCTELPSDPAPTDSQFAVGLIIGGYDISDLELPAGYTAGWARAINERGDLIVGESWGPGSTAAVAWPSGGQPFLLGTLPGHTDSYAYGVNDAGQVVGASRGAASEAFLYTPGTGMVSIHDPALFVESEAKAITNKGIVIGSGTTAAGVTRAFRWTATGGMQVLSQHDAVAEDISDTGTVVGRTVAGNPRGILWAKGGVRILSTLGGDYSEASGINDTGLVVGSSDLADLFTRHVFLYKPTISPLVANLTDLGPAASFYALGRKISDLGRVVGVDESTANAITYYNGKMIQLPDHGWTADAFDVSRCGTIVGFAFTPLGGQQRPVRWDTDTKKGDCK